MFDDLFQKYVIAKIEQKNKIVLVFSNKRFLILDLETFEILDFIYYQNQISIDRYEISVIYPRVDEIDKFKLLVYFYISDDISYFDNLQFNLLSFY